MDFEKLRKSIGKSDADDEQAAEIVFNAIRDMSKIGIRPYLIAMALVGAANSVVLYGENNDALKSFGQYQNDLGNAAKATAQRKEWAIHQNDES